ncbi:MAG: efflux RND transporter periplasmic adaptor subunit [Alphaproteobacteria bacterium]|jgi:multidrug efflux system membrane fusion protein|nr:efflux RND transporter periplasmic adaptor subunit [Alphaproteobacteria bacterium]
MRAPRLLFIGLAVLLLAAGGVALWQGWGPFASGGGMAARQAGGNGGGDGGGGPPIPGRGPQGPVPVTVQPVTTRTVPIFRDYVGTVRAIQSAELRARVEGHVVALPFDEGSLVAEGDVLVRLDTRPIEAELEQLRGERAALVAERTFQERQLARFSALEREDFATEERIDRITRSLERARAEIAALDGEIRALRLDRDFATVAAPFDGLAGFAAVDLGDLVVPGQDPLVSVVQTDPIFVEFEPVDTELTRLQAPDGAGPRPLQVIVRFDDGRALPEPGTLTQLDNAFDEATGTIRARATVPNPGTRLRPGQFVRARLILEERENAVLVPAAALATEQGRRFVYRIDETGTARRTAVETGRVYDGLTLVTDGLSPGDRIATDNLQRLSDGTPVKVDPAS